MHALEQLKAQCEMAEFSESDASTFGTGSELEPENDVMAPLSTSTPIIKHQRLVKTGINCHISHDILRRQSCSNGSLDPH